jgi:MFS family permease
MPLEVGTISLVVGLAGFAGAPIGGSLAAHLYKRTGRLKTSYIKIIIFGGILSITGWGSIPFIVPYAFGATIAVTFLMGFGIYASLTNIYALIATDYKPEHVSLASGFSTFIASIPEPAAATVLVAIAGMAGWVIAWLQVATVGVVAGILIPYFYLRTTNSQRRERF